MLLAPDLQGNPMNRAVLAIALVSALSAPTFALAEGADGSRQAAGGGFMSSYVSDPYHDPRSVRSQRLGSGQILGAPMFHEGAGHHARRPVGGHWASGHR
jgi:hypothetical protein